jgi:tRNA(fMet)-specific endonuclease VapC
VEFLIDTSVIVAWERRNLDFAALEQRLHTTTVAISAITASELLHGVHRANSAYRRSRRGAFVNSLLSAVPVISFDLEVARIHAVIWSDLSQRGQLIGAHDLLIAATALAHGLKVATRNKREFERVENLAIEVW